MARVLLLKLNKFSLLLQRKDTMKSAIRLMWKGKGMRVLVGFKSQRSGSKCALRNSKIQRVTLNPAPASLIARCLTLQVVYVFVFVSVLS